MEKNGSITDKRVLLSKLVFLKLKKAEKNLYNSETGVQVEELAKNLTKFLSQTIKDKNISVLFELERNAIECDIACYGESDKRDAAKASLNQASSLFQHTSTINGAQKYLKEQNGGSLPKKIPPSDLVQKFVKSQKTLLTQMINDTSSPALKTYRMYRKEALELIRKEYIKNLEQGLGKTVVKDRGISR